MCSISGGECDDADLCMHYYTTSHVTSGQRKYDWHTYHYGHKWVKDKINKECMNHGRQKCQSFV